jgi:hypothetical protein
MHALIDRSYRWIAAHRGCTGRDKLCLVPLINGTPPAFAKGSGLGGQRASLPARVIPWIGLLLLPALALFTRNQVPPWLFMWLMAGAIFFGGKWLTFWRAKKLGIHLHLRRLPGYFFFWAGMDAARFLGSGSARDPRAEFGDPPNCNSGFQNLGRVARDSTRVACAPILKIAFGLLALFFLARLAPNHLLAGWIGMIGLIFILHFGLFALTAMAWRMEGVDAKPIMNAPIKAKSLNEFWGRRWNGAFNQLVLDIFFRPLTRSIGGVRATLTAFLISGLVHELVISLPAGAGYGLPTAYFLLQGWGVVAQRSSIGKRLRLRQGGRGWLFTMLLTAGPAFWLFHPPFVERVIVPFMQTIGAL